MDGRNIVSKMNQVIELEGTALRVFTPDSLATVNGAFPITQVMVVERSSLIVERQYRKVRFSIVSRSSPKQSGHCLASSKSGKEPVLNSISGSGAFSLIGTPFTYMSLRRRFLVSLLLHSRGESPGRRERVKRQVYSRTEGEF